MKQLKYVQVYYNLIYERKNYTLKSPHDPDMNPYFNNSVFKLVKKIPIWMFWFLKFAWKRLHNLTKLLYKWMAYETCKMRHHNSISWRDSISYSPQNSYYIFCGRIKVIMENSNISMLPDHILHTYYTIQSGLWQGHFNYK